MKLYDLIKEEEEEEEKKKLEDGPYVEIEKNFEYYDDEDFKREPMYKVKLFGTIKNGKKNGIETVRLEPHGNVIVKQKYVDGILNGPYVQYYFSFGDDEVVKSRGVRINGKKNGKVFTFHKNGMKESEGVYVDNKKNGEFILYSEKGFIEKIINFKDNLLDGPWFHFMSKSKDELEKKSKIVGNYKEGLKHGIFRYFDDYGDVEAIIEYKNGVADGQYYHLSPSFVERVGKLSGGGSLVFTGVERTFHEPHGEVKRETNFKEGRKHGEEKEFYEDGTIKDIGQWNDGNQVGIWKRYDKEGKLQFEINYDLGGYTIDPNR